MVYVETEDRGTRWEHYCHLLDVGGNLSTDEWADWTQLSQEFGVGGDTSQCGHESPESLKEQAAAAKVARKDELAQKRKDDALAVAQNVEWHTRLTEYKRINDAHPGIVQRINDNRDSNGEYRGIYQYGRIIPESSILRDNADHRADALWHQVEITLDGRLVRIWTSRPHFL